MYAPVAKYFIGRDSSEKLLNYNPKISCILIITKHVKLVSQRSGMFKAFVEWVYRNVLIDI